MASKEPPLIRSSKAFSVEIPEGSSSAKSRKSDVVAGLEEGFSPSDPHFEASSMLSEQDHVSENDILHDPSVKVSTDQPSRDSNSTFTQESITDHLVGVAEDGLQDHVVGIANDSSRDHYAGLAQDNLVDNHASLPDEAIEDRVEAVAEPEAPIPLFVSADDDFPDDHMEIEYPPDVDPNVQALSDEALVDHVEQVKEESVVRASRSSECNCGRTTACQYKTCTTTSSFGQKIAAVVNARHGQTTQSRTAGKTAAKGRISRQG